MCTILVKSAALIRTQSLHIWHEPHAHMEKQIPQTICDTADIAWPGASVQTIAQRKRCDRWLFGALDVGCLPHADGATHVCRPLWDIVYVLNNKRAICIDCRCFCYCFVFTSFMYYTAKRTTMSCVHASAIPSVLPCASAPFLWSPDAALKMANPSHTLTSIACQNPRSSWILA